MKIVADESVIVPVITALRGAGHEVLSIRETRPGAADEYVLCLANQERSLLVTFDKDFGDLIFRQKLASSGAVLVRLKGLPTQTKTQTVLATIEKYGTRKLGLLNKDVIQVGDSQLQPSPLCFNDGRAQLS